MAGLVFSLRLRQDRIRTLVRLVAEQEGLSQNELLEQAAEHEVIARGAMLADDLEASLQKLRSATDAAHRDVVARSLVDFAEGEAQADPLRAYQIGGPGSDRHLGEPLRAVSAFRRRA